MLKLQGIDFQAAVLSALHAQLHPEEQKLPQSATPAAAEHEAGSIHSSTSAAAQQGLDVMPAGGVHTSTQGEAWNLPKGQTSRLPLA